MNIPRFQLLRLHVAQLLHASDPMLSPEGQLLMELRAYVNPAPTQAEFDHVIERMEAARQITRLRTEDEGVKTKLTDVGIAELTR